MAREDNGMRFGRVLSGWQIAIDRSMPKSIAAESTAGESSKKSVEAGLNFNSA
jgi:hypothetical protein